MSNRSGKLFLSKSKAIKLIGYLNGRKQTSLLISYYNLNILKDSFGFYYCLLPNRENRPGHDIIKFIWLQTLYSNSPKNLIWIWSQRTTQLAAFISSWMEVAKNQCLPSSPFLVSLSRWRSSRELWVLQQLISWVKENLNFNWHQSCCDFPQYYLWFSTILQTCHGNANT